MTQCMFIFRNLPFCILLINVYLTVGVKENQTTAASLIIPLKTVLNSTKTKDSFGTTKVVGHPEGTPTGISICLSFIVNRLQKAGYR